MKQVDVSDLAELPVSPILRHQNDTAMQHLLRAMSASHWRAQRLDTASTAVSIIIAALGVMGTFVPAVSMQVTAIGAVWALTYSTGLATWTGAELRRAAKIQEEFDVRLFRIAWNDVLAGDRIEPPEINQLSARFRGRTDIILDYYEIPDLHPPYDIIACQMMSLGWGARVRRRFAQAILVLLFTWLAAGIVLGVFADVTIGRLLLGWYVPSLGGLMLGLDMFRRQRGVVDERQRVLQLLRRRVAAMLEQSPGPDIEQSLLTLARQVQDSIFLTRVACPRVPDWFFLRFRATDSADFAADMDELVRRWPLVRPDQESTGGPGQTRPLVTR
jgi:predicted pore-forming effector associated with SMODS systems